MTKIYKLTIFLLILLTSMVQAAIAQSTTVYAMGDQRNISSCNGFFTDSGGRLGNYSPNEDLSTLICPNPGSFRGTHVKLSFSEIDLGTDDIDDIAFYDGRDETAPLLSMASEFLGQTPFVIQATAANTTGCIYVVFTSNQNNEGAGWLAKMSCVPACQQIEAVLVSSDPAVSPVDTGYIDVCPGERIQLTAEGRYPQSGITYEHSDLNATFEWDLGDGTIAYGPTITHAYAESGGYVIQLTITDQFGCTNTNFINQRVRVSPLPTFNIGGVLDSEICVNDTISLTANTTRLDPDRNISVRTNEGSFFLEAARSDSLGLPDGTGISYKTAIELVNFSPAQTLENIDDLLSICVNIEHSWLRDLEISITCPSGNTVILHNHPSRSGTGVFLGEPFDQDNSNPIPGIGYDYCWVPNTTKPTWIEWANLNTNNPGLETLPAGDYASFQSLEDLLGCPLNGEWTITVEDLWGQDNGFIFSWGINFDPKLYPNIEVFTPEIVDYGWDSNPTIITQTPDSLVASPQTAGSAAYQFTIVDDFGCSYDTSLVIDILPQTHPDCFSCDDPVTTALDTAVCDGEIIELNIVPVADDLAIPIAFAAYPAYQFGATNHPPALPYESKMKVNSIYPTVINNPIMDIERVCLDIETDWTEDIAVILRSPTGVLLPLVSGVGGAGQHFESTCFTPLATTPIDGGTAPFAGDFLPQGNWDALIGSPTNGDWTLLVSDAFGLTTFSKLKSWSITFRTTNDVTYAWDADNSLSCTDCPNPVFSPTQTTTYTLNTSDNFGCTTTQDVQINVVGGNAAPSVRCDITDPFELTYEWTGNDDTGTYEIRINGGAWQVPNNGNTSHVLSGVTFDEDNEIEVRIAGTSNLNCEPPTGRSTCRYDVCMMTASILNMPQDASCSDTADGSVNIVANNGVRPYTYMLDNNPVQMDSVFNNLAPGNYTIVVRDNATPPCEISVPFTIAAPDAIVLNITPTNPSCFGFTNGEAIVTATDGVAPYTYMWSNGSTQNSTGDVNSGTYSVTVTDANNCEAVDVVTLTQPDEIVLAINVTDISCAGDSDGGAIVNPSGGTAPYTYAWSNGDTGIEARNLDATNHQITVTDANGCTKIQGFTVAAPSSLVIQQSGTKPTSCAGGNDGEAFVIVQGGTAPYSYLWNNSQQANDATATNLTQGQYTVTVTDARNCTVTSTVTVGEPTALTITGISMTDVSCLGGSNGTATVTVSGGTGPYQYVWSDANAQTTTTATDLSAGTYTVTVFDNNSCEITNTVTLTEPTTAVSATLSQTFMGCFGAREGEATVMPTGGTAPYTYNWSDGQQTAEAVDLSPIQNFVTVTDANGCTFIDFVEINDLPEITFSLLNSNPTCFGLEDGKMAVNNLNGGIGTGVYTYAWSTVPVQTTEIADNLAGDRSYTVTVTDEQGCIGTDTRILTQPSEIQFDFDATPARCFGEATGTASIINVVSENDITDYQWDLAAANQTTPTATGLATGVYEVTITDANDCAVTKSVDIEQPEPLETEFTVTDNRCFGEDNGVISVDASGGTPGYLYNWSTNDTAEKIGTLLAGTYSLTLTDFNNCTRVDEVEVAQPSAISATLTPDTVGCFGDRNGGIIIDPAGGTPPYLYSLDNENFNGSQNIIGLTAGDYSVYVQDANGCTWFDVATVATPEEFSVDIVGTDGSDLVAVGDSLELFGEVMNAVGDVEYIWSSAVADVLSCNECSSTFVKPMNTLYVEVYAVDANGCEAEDRLQVMVKKDRVVLVPTGFTPDANGRNDKLMVHGAEGSMIKTFRVFDRWGEQMYEQNEFSINDQSAGWDGNFRSRPAPAGVYVWYLEVEYIDGVREILKGNTTLIR